MPESCAAPDEEISHCWLSLLVCISCNICEAGNLFCSLSLASSVSLIYLCTAQNFRFRWLRRGRVPEKEESTGVRWRRRRGRRAIVSSFVLHKLGNKKSVYAFATCYLCGRATNLANCSLPRKCCTVNEAGKKGALGENV